MHSTVHFLFFIVAFLTNFAKSQQSVAKTDETDPRCALSLKRQDLFKECLNKSYPVVDKVLNDTLGWEHFTDTARKICDPLSVLEPQIQPEVLAPSTAEPQDQANAVTPRLCRLGGSGSRKPCEGKIEAERNSVTPEGV
ncbi:uncharacterized protein LOC144173451 isoform X2 [Haemaphysalis longicornis]